MYLEDWNAELLFNDVVGNIHGKLNRRGNSLVGIYQKKSTAMLSKQSFMNIPTEGDYGFKETQSVIDELDSDVSDSDLSSLGSDLETDQSMLSVSNSDIMTIESITEPGSSASVSVTKGINNQQQQQPQES